MRLLDPPPSTNQHNEQHDNKATGVARHENYAAQCKPTR